MQLSSPLNLQSSDQDDESPPLTPADPDTSSTDNTQTYESPTFENTDLTFGNSTYSASPSDSTIVSESDTNSELALSRRPSRNTRPPQRWANECTNYRSASGLVAVEDIIEPLYYRDAIASPQSDHWIAAMEDEMNSLTKIRPDT